MLTAVAHAFDTEFTKKDRVRCRSGCIALHAQGIVLNQNTKPPVRPSQRNQTSVFGTPWPLDPPLLRIRLRYVAARFLQVPEPRVSLRNTDDMLRWAQQMQDDGMPRSATELMRLAIEEDPAQRPLWQFLLARAVEDDNATEFTELAQAFALQFPNDAAMAEITAMGQKMLGGHGLSPTTSNESVQSTWRSSAFFRRDDSGQRFLHDSLLQEIK